MRSSLLAGVAALALVGVLGGCASTETKEAATRAEQAASSAEAAAGRAEAAARSAEQAARTSQESSERVERMLSESMRK